MHFSTEARYDVVAEREADRMLGKGVYLLTEVARYTGAPAGTVRSWFKPRSDDRGLGPLLRSEFAPVGEDFAVSFLNLIEAYVARFFRKVRPPVKVSHIRRVYKKLQEELGTNHPFAHLSLCAADGRIIIQKEGHLTDAIDSQAWFVEMRHCLNHIEYEPNSKLANRWNIAPGIAIDPAIQFGKPVVKGTGVATLILANQFVANKRNAPLVADLYDVDESDVINAFRFEKKYGSLRAA